MKVTFIFKGSVKPPISYENIARRIIILVKKLYVLPDTIEIQFESMGPNIYGMTMLDPRFPNRVRINQDLSLQEFILPLVHELLHLHQIFTNKLQTRSGGRILWENNLYKVDTLKLSYEEYVNLPWEVDVAIKQKGILDTINQHSKKWVK